MHRAVQILHIPLHRLDVCLKNETISVVALFCGCPVTPFLWQFLISSIVYVSPCLSVFTCQTVYTELFFSCIRRTFFLMIFHLIGSSYLYFNSMPLDRNTLPKKGLRYRTHEDSDPDFYCIYLDKLHWHICMAIISKIQNFHVFACVACFCIHFYVACALDQVKKWR